MKKITKIAALAVLVLGVAAMLQPANATCSSARLFGTGDSYIYTPGCGYNGCDTAGGATSMTDSATGVFWAIDTGNPDVGPGNDSGSLPFADWSGFQPGYPTYIPGNASWAAPGGIDNCIDASTDNKCMAILIMDNDADTGSGAFALLTDEPNALGNYSFDQGGPINLVAVDKLNITGTVRTGGGTGIDVSVGGVSLTDIEAGLYLDPNCAQGETLIPGYRVFSREVPGGDPAPDNDAANWTPEAAIVPLGSPGSASVACSGDPTVDKYVTAGIVFDSGYETVLLSGNSTRMECGANLADPDVDIERKPRNREKPRSRSRGR